MRLPLASYALLVLIAGCAPRAPSRVVEDPVAAKRQEDYIQAVVLGEHIKRAGSYFPVPPALVSRAEVVESLLTVAREKDNEIVIQAVLHAERTWDADRVFDPPLTLLQVLLYDDGGWVPFDRRDNTLDFPEGYGRMGAGPSFTSLVKTIRENEKKGVPRRNVAGLRAASGK